VGKIIIWLQNCSLPDKNCPKIFMLFSSLHSISKTKFNILLVGGGGGGGGGCLSRFKCSAQTVTDQLILITY